MISDILRSDSTPGAFKLESKYCLASLAQVIANRFYCSDVSRLRWWRFGCVHTTDLNDELLTIPDCDLHNRILRRDRRFVNEIIPELRSVIPVGTGRIPKPCIRIIGYRCFRAFNLGVDSSRVHCIFSSCQLAPITQFGSAVKTVYGSMDIHHHVL